MQTRWGGCFHVRRRLVVQHTPSPSSSPPQMLYMIIQRPSERETNQESRRARGRKERKEETARACPYWQNQAYVRMLVSCTKGAWWSVTGFMVLQCQQPIGTLSLADISTAAETTELMQQLAERWAPLTSQVVCDVCCLAFFFHNKWKECYHNYFRLFN